MKPRILFVDDDPYVLQGLRRMLLPMRREWDLGFLQSAREALQEMQNGAYAVLVSDLRMPGTDGIAFLARARELSPGTVRILLSGYADRENALRAVKEAGVHRFLVKPCQAEVLTSTIREGIFCFQHQEQKPDEIGDGLLQEKGAGGRVLVDDIIARFRRGAISLPPVPQINIKFNELLKKGAGLEEITATLKTDPAISSQLISVSNSVYYRGVEDTKSLEEAVKRLGLTTTKQYVDAIFARSLSVLGNKRYADVMGSLWEHSLACAHASRMTAETLRLSCDEDIFTVGLLHDIGKLVLLRIVSDLECSGTKTDNVNAAELRETIQHHHGRFGAGVLQRWRFPEVYCEVALHHDDLTQADKISRPLLIVNFANALVKAMGYQNFGGDGVVPDEVASARLLGLQAPVIQEIREKVSEVMRGTRDSFS